MDSFEWNKIFGAIIATALFVMVITTLSESVFHHGEGGKPAFTVEVATAEGAGDAVVEEAPSLAALMAMANAGRGAKVFGKCKACHTGEKGGRNGAGPNLYGIVGRGIAAVDGFKYSSALAGQNANWTWDLLNDWIISPKKTFKGTSMSFPGLKKDGQRADLLAYLGTLSDAPIELPTDAVEEAGEAMEAVHDEMHSAAETVPAAAAGH